MSFFVLLHTKEDIWKNFRFWSPMTSLVFIYLFFIEEVNEDQQLFVNLNYFVFNTKKKLIQV